MKAINVASETSFENILKTDPKVVNRGVYVYIMSCDLGLKYDMDTFFYLNYSIIIY